MDDADTLGTLEEDATGARGVPLVPCLTIAYHPDPARIGERAFVLKQESKRPLLLSRTELAFGAPREAREAAPLGDPHLSRAPIELTAARDGIVIAAPGRARLAIDGALCEGEVRLDAGAVERGVILELGKSAVLVLHLAAAGARPSPHGLVGESRAIDEVRRAIARVADLDVPVLIRGETGVGKERVAQAIHEGSGLPGACVAVNVATLAPSLAASELFGHAKGAFTGASERRVGLFARAHEGTLFLDEIGELSSEVQPMLLRALETGRALAIGDRDEHEARVRVIAATDADLDALVREGRFRAALFHRLRGFEITVPPLRDRREDIARLAIAFLREELAKTGELERLAPRSDGPPWLDRALVPRLLAHPWPGNVRQLRGVVRQLVVASRGERTLRADAAVERVLAEEPSHRAEARPAIETTQIEAALRAHAWSFGKAARALGITRSALYRRVESEPSLRTSGEIDRAELERCLDEHGGDLGAVAARLRVSKRALRLRMRALGLA